MADIRQIEISQAQANPGILSPLSGAGQPNSVELKAPPDAQAAYGQARQAGQDVANKLYGPGVIQGIGGNIDQMTKALFDYDQQLEKGMSPYPQTPSYVENPADLYRAGAGFAGRQAGNIGKAQSAVETINQAYSNAVEGVVNKFLQFYEIAEAKRREKEDAERQERNSYLDRLIQIATRTPGGMDVDIGGRTMRVPGPEPSQRGTSVVEVGGRKKLIDTQTGQVIQDLGEANVTSPIFNIQGAQTTKPATKPITKPKMNLSFGDITAGSSAQLKKPALDSFWRQ